MTPANVNSSIGNMLTSLWLSHQRVCLFFDIPPVPSSPGWRYYIICVAANAWPRAGAICFDLVPVPQLFLESRGRRSHPGSLPAEADCDLAQLQPLCSREPYTHDGGLRKQMSAYETVCHLFRQNHNNAGWPWLQMRSFVSKIIAANRWSLLFCFFCYEVSFWVRVEGQIIPTGVGECYRVLKVLNHSIGLCPLF